MIWFAVKTCLIIATIATGSVLLIDNVLFLKANILEVVNPRVQEGKLVEQLQTTLTKIQNASTDATRDKLIAESQELIDEITKLNEEHSGIVDGVVSKVTEALLGTPPSPSASEGAEQATRTPTETSGQVTVTVTVTPEGCK